MAIKWPFPPKQPAEPERLSEFKSLNNNQKKPRNCAFNKIEDGILYRLQNTRPGGLGDPNKGGVGRGPERIDLADIPIPGGIIRVDRVRVPYRYELQLGHFALPHLDGFPTAFLRFF